MPFRLLLNFLPLLYSSLLGAHAQSSCDHVSAAAISFSIRNLTLSQGVIRRGVGIPVGTPPQNIAFFPVFLYVSLQVNDMLTRVSRNNTYVYDAGDFCPSNIDPLLCILNHGGQYDPGSSASYQRASGQAAAGASGDDGTQNAGDIWGTESLQLNGTNTIHNIPISIQRGNDLNYQCLGVGSNSTVMNALQNAQSIASRTWSFWWGQNGGDPASQMDGSMIFGGYDSGKTTGPNSTQPLSHGQDCPTLVTVTAINMNFPNGTNFNILGNSHGAALRMCVETSYPLITIPFDIWTNFQDNAGGTYLGRSEGLNSWGEVYGVDGVYVHSKETAESS